jgi:Cft2 family RNA processing exonuclease
MQVDFRPRGIHLPEIDLWLDCTEDCWNTWMSHAHSDHAHGLHGRIFGTPETLGIYRERVPIPPDDCPECTEMHFGEAVEYHGARLTAFSASHILGAAQLLIEYKGERLVYTGDIKLRDPLCGVSTEVVACDRLIVESTFGLPIYRFISREQARDRITAFARECLDEGITPVFVGYPLGRGQEIVHVLCEAAIPTAVHGSIARFIPWYQRAGYRFDGWEPYENRATAGKALVVVPDFRNYLQARGKNIRIAYVSGWAALDNARTRVGAEALIPYSDHADFDELLALVERSGAREVDIVHGYTEPFARMLRKRGLDARAPMPETAREAAAEQEG